MIDIPWGFIADKVFTGLAAGTGAYAVAWWHLRRQQQAIEDGELKDEVLIVANVVEDVSGVPFLKPRTVQSERPLVYYFSNEALARAIVDATHRCSEGDPESQFIMLADARTQDRLMKRVVNIASGIGAIGHLRRMFRRPIEKNDGFVCITYSQAGTDDWIIRIDLISQDDLQKFLDPEFVAQLAYRPEEGSHADNAAIFAYAARIHFKGAASKARAYVRRVSLPTMA